MSSNNQTLIERISELLTSDTKHNISVENLEFLTHQLAKENDNPDSPSLLAHKFIACAQSLTTHVQSRKLGAYNINAYNTDKISLSGEEITVLEIVNDDMPFIVDSITQLLSEKEIEIIDFFHPVINVVRDKEGEFVDFYKSNESIKGLPESFIQIHLTKIINNDVIADLKQEINVILQDIRLATSDWQVMLRKLDGIIADLGSSSAPIDHETKQESVSFLRWLGVDHFTFLGSRSYSFTQNAAGEKSVVTVPDSGLGLFRNPNYVVLRHDGDMVDSFPELEKLSTLETPVTILKTNMKATVHRRAHMDQIFIVFYENGQPVGLHSFIGLFTSTAYTTRASKVPLLERKIHTILSKTSFRPQSHDGKLLTHILDSYPRDELFQTDIDTLCDIIAGIISLDQRPAIRMFPRHDLFNRFVSCLVYLPRERLNTEHRQKIGELLAKSYGGRLSTFSIWFSESTYVRIKYIIAVTPSSLLTPDVAKIEQKIKKITTDWRDSFAATLLHSTDTEISMTSAMARNKANNFSISYQAYYSPKSAVKDMEILSKISEKLPIICDIKNAKDSDLTIFRLFNYQAPLALSDCLPIFENLGFKVLTEHPFDLNHNEQHIQLHEFGMQYLGKGTPYESVNNLSEAFIAIYNGHVENDEFNSLIIRSNLSYRQVMVLRAFSGYLKQAGLTYSQQKIAECLLTHSHIARLIWELFDTYHNPSKSKDNREATVLKIEGKINHALLDVAVLDQDTIIRRYVNLIKAILRTNFYANKPYVSFKIKSSSLDNLPLPVPYREIWVYSPRVEGVHLRFGEVARGGLRWSDRREDFRTEVLGLVKAQQVKNSVIVPVGAKGCFYAKKLPAPSQGRDAWVAEGIEAYKTFINGLLDITDNIVNKKIIAPKNIIRRDDDDPYLVVAADKGTATFSDIANSLSLERNFWLGDAFASGGSNGYDHKKMGITARGAWEAVKRHFREKGKDIQTQDFTVCGVGDMSGDVFGNGMLLSKKIRLLAAFDHRDIFIDPNPETKNSFVERQRLFDLPRSTWQDYNKDLISKGGSVFSRSAKEITLTPEIQALTGLKETKVRPNDLMKAVLRLNTELLWFGGIGTYIRADHETDMQVGDKANDAIRITASDVRAQVVGEGANLGLTQPARIMMSMNGVMINTDAVDNSAGVDCSDHEVNIKIALGIEQAAGRMDEPERNKLLEAMTDEVADLVLQTNYNQTLGLSITTAAAQKRADLHARFMNHLETHASLNRTVENLPDNRSLLAGRNGIVGLVRPELSVVMAYSKLKLYDDVLKSHIPDEPLFDEIVKEYMPTPLHSMDEALDTHRLRREIITTVITNRAINEGGISFVFRLCERLNISVEHAMRSYIAARRTMNFGDLSDQVHALDNKVPYALQQKLYIILRASLFDQTRCIALRNSEGFDIGKTVEKYRDRFSALIHNINNNLEATIEKKLNAFIIKHKHENIPEALGSHICALYFMKNGFDIIDIALESNTPFDKTFKHYSSTIEKLDMDSLRRKATEIPLPDIYDQMALSQIISDMDLANKALVMKILASGQDIEAWFKDQNHKLVKFQETFSDAIAVPQLGLSRLSIITGALRQLSSE
ncbi:MAG: glutamate dehydrogenase [Alphaproteobacteria bacterium]|jgi:glutamate dehydrogenase